jgi:hypothetical protein
VLVRCGCRCDRLSGVLLWWPPGPVASLAPFLHGGHQAPQAEEIFLSLRHMQENLALLDRVHSIRIKHIQVNKENAFPAPNVPGADLKRLAACPCERTRQRTASVNHPHPTPR